MRDRDRQETEQSDIQEYSGRQNTGKGKIHNEERSREFPHVSALDLQKMIRELPEGMLLEVYLS